MLDRNDVTYAGNHKWTNGKGKQVVDLKSSETQTRMRISIEKQLLNAGPLAKSGLLQACGVVHVEAAFGRNLKTGDADKSVARVTVRKFAGGDILGHSEVLEKGDRSDSEFFNFIQASIERVKREWKKEYALSLEEITKQANITGNDFEKLSLVKAFLDLEF